MNKDKERTLNICETMKRYGATYVNYDNTSVFCCFNYLRDAITTRQYLEIYGEKRININECFDSTCTMNVFK